MDSCIVSPRQSFAGLSLASYHAMSALSIHPRPLDTFPSHCQAHGVIVRDSTSGLVGSRVTMLNLAFYRTDITALMLMCSVYPTFSHDDL